MTPRSAKPRRRYICLGPLVRSATMNVAVRAGPLHRVHHQRRSEAPPAGGRRGHQLLDLGVPVAHVQVDVGDHGAVPPTARPGTSRRPRHRPCGSAPPAGGPHPRSGRPAIPRWRRRCARPGRARRPRRRGAAGASARPAPDRRCARNRVRAAAASTASATSRSWTWINRCAASASSRSAAAASSSAPTGAVMNRRLWSWASG